MSAVSSRLLLLIGLGTAAAAAVVLAATVWWGDAPRRDVEAPPPSASPRQVVATYLEALDAHDFETAGQLLAPGFREHAEETWFDDVDTVTDVEVGRPFQENPKWSGNPPGVEVMNVPVTFDVQWRWLHNDGSMEEGRTEWGYLLERSGPSAPWRIFDDGSG